MRPCSEYLGRVYALLVGLTGLCGRSARSRALRSMPGVALDAGVWAAAGVGGTSTGRPGVRVCFCAPVPGRGPGEPSPFGPGLGAVPGAFETAAALVGLGLGTPGCEAGGADAAAAGAGRLLGAALACGTAATAVGAALGATGAGLAALAVGAAVGEGGRGDGWAEGAAVGAGEGAAVGGALSATATGATVGTLTGAAGTSLRGCSS